ncbi:MAG: DUF3500 domain-containing protein [bacterium]|nr:DUF3500 domain-containing protein [bacterium]
MGATRRQLLKYGSGLAVTAVAGVGWRLLVAPSPSRELAPVTELATRLFERLSDGNHEQAFVPYDHPLRQFHNRGVDTGGILAVGLDYKARSILTDLFHASLSPVGRSRVPNQLLLEVPGVHATRLLFAGTPHDKHFQVHVTGPHINLRIGGRNLEAVAFGGPQVYGDQRSDGEIGLPNNIYRYQLELGQRLYGALTPAERGMARLSLAPPQTAVEVRGAGVSFDGIAVADLSAEKRKMARAVVAGVLENYREEDSAYAWECIAKGGGIEVFHFADYKQDFQGGRLAGDGASQIFRLESPAAVFHYRGEPHLHAFFNVAMDGEKPLSLGEALAVNPNALDVEGVERLFESVMLEHGGVDFAFYPRNSVAGRLRAGMIRSGDIYNLESWKSTIEILEVRGRDVDGAIAARLSTAGEKLQDTSTYRIATIDWAANHPKNYGLTNATSIDGGNSLRETTISYLKRSGFAA